MHVRLHHLARWPNVAFVELTVVVDPEQRAQLRPGDRPVPWHEHEEEVIVGAAHDDRLDDVGRRHAACDRGLGQAANPSVRNDPVCQAMT